jgi:hypothetical protein
MFLAQGVLVRTRKYIVSLKMHPDKASNHEAHMMLRNKKFNFEMAQSAIASLRAKYHHIAPGYS